MTRTKDYFQSAIGEMRKVTWPTKQQTIQYGIFVIAMSIGLMLFLGVLDYIFNAGIENIIK
ncbi:MAG: preprotein translocase subunit SecE [Candidatus Magasanikbacteria bacterium RIFCSPHIGHO2_02_FULL_41_13]|uniref:Protein translocase subunit SecE n=1 Tax=Candidatus Magasanikbacteria bacterium RIFCSPHIGHO2_02_FULL_41_13 TaxID=1798676 RepID=A0A1F6M461_9BACT|nr:MAG: preprotein translocase subunit SecE [Candidatus Magasanikbacteria bacterium RIFCSPHIGHO2_02_FULL_41_13]